jgi:hypothetical protein
MATQTQGAPTNLMRFSLSRPVLAMLVLYVIAYLVKLLDTLVLPVNELVGEAIITKVVGFLLVAAYVWACGRSLRDIGYHRRGMGQSLLVGGVTVGGLYVLSYGVQLAALRASGADASWTVALRH